MRQPSALMAAAWAYERPYDHWTIWSEAWIAVTDRPSYVSVDAKMRGLFAYDTHALEKMIRG